MPNSLGLWCADRSGQIEHYNDLQFVCWYLYQVWYWLAVSLEEMLVSQRRSPSHALLMKMLFLRKWAFGELTMHYTSPPTRGEFRAKIVSYDSNRNCLVSSLSFHATSLHMHGPTVSKHVPRLLANPHVLVQRSLRCARQAYTANTYNYNLIRYLVAAAITWNNDFTKARSSADSTLHYFSDERSQ